MKQHEEGWHAGSEGRLPAACVGGIDPPAELHARFESGRPVAWRGGGSGWEGDSVCCLIFLSEHALLWQ